MKKEIKKEIKNNFLENTFSKKNLTYFIIIILIIFSFVISFYFDPFLPEKIATHWGFNGEADGFAQKGFGLYFLPGLILIVTMVLVFLPKLDPLKKNIESIWGNYLVFVSIFIIFMIYLQGLTIFWNLGNNFNFSQAIAPAFGGLFLSIGWLIKDIKRNYFIGIRTPWTLNDEKVWIKTHKFSGKLFIISGLLCFAAIFFPEQAILLILLPIITSAIISVVYSYLNYKKLHN